MTSTASSLTPRAVFTPQLGDVYAKTRERDARLRLRVSRAKVKEADAHYAEALAELRRYGLATDDDGERIPVSIRTRVQALRAYLASFKPDPAIEEEPAPRNPKITINIGLPPVREPPPKKVEIEVKKTTALPPVPPAQNGNGKAREGA